VIDDKFGLPIATSMDKGEDNDFYNKELIMRNFKTPNKNACILLEKDIIYGNKKFLIIPHYLYTADMNAAFNKIQFNHEFLKKKYEIDQFYIDFFEYAKKYNLSQETVTAVLKVFDSGDIYS
jgi:hypothetical protein